MILQALMRCWPVGLPAVAHIGLDLALHTFEVGPEFRRRLAAQVAILLQTLEDGGFQRRRHVGPNLSRPRVPARVSRVPGKADGVSIPTDTRHSAIPPRWNWARIGDCPA